MSVVTERTALRSSQKRQMGRDAMRSDLGIRATEEELQFTSELHSDTFT